jgi:hypothetical protein
VSGFGSARPFCCPMPAHEEPRSADPGPLLEGHLPRRQRSARCSVRTPAGCRLRPSRGCGSLGSTITPAGAIATCLPSGTSTSGPMALRPGPAALPVDHRRHRRQEGTGRACRRHPRKRAILEGAAARSQAARFDERPAARRRRRSASGRRSTRCCRRHERNAARCTKPRMS